MTEGESSFCHNAQAVIGSSVKVGQTTFNPQQHVGHRVRGHSCHTEPPERQMLIFRAMCRSTCVFFSHEYVGTNYHFGPAWCL